MAKSQTTVNKNNAFSITDFQFLGDFVLVKPIRAVSKDKRLTDPAQYDDKPEFGEVISVGERVPDNIKVGSVIWFGKYSSEQIRNNEQDYYVIFYEDVKGVLKHE